MMEKNIENYLVAQDKKVSLVLLVFLEQDCLKKQKILLKNLLIRKQDKDTVG